MLMYTWYIYACMFWICEDISEYPSDFYFDVSVVRILGCAFTSEPTAHALPSNMAYPVRLTWMQAVRFSNIFVATVISLATFNKWSAFSSSPIPTEAYTKTHTKTHLITTMNLHFYIFINLSNHNHGDCFAGTDVRMCVCMLLICRHKFQQIAIALAYWMQISQLNEIRLIKCLRCTYVRACSTHNWKLNKYISDRWARRLIVHICGTICQFETNTQILNFFDDIIILTTTFPFLFSILAWLIDCRLINFSANRNGNSKHILLCLLSLSPFPFFWLISSFFGKIKTGEKISKRWF